MRGQGEAFDHRHFSENKTLENATTCEPILISIRIFSNFRMKKREKEGTVYAYVKLVCFAKKISLFIIEN